MFSRLAIGFARPAAKPVASIAGRTAWTVRFYSAKTAVPGSKGRKMPSKATQATAPVSSLPATFTIRVSSLRTGL